MRTVDVDQQQGRDQQGQDVAQVRHEEAAAEGVRDVGKAQGMGSDLDHYAGLNLEWDN